MERYTFKCGRDVWHMVFRFDRSGTITVRILKIG